MDDIIVIFSPDTIRGNIIHKSLHWHGLPSKLFNKLYETEAAIHRLNPPLLIIDTVGCLSKTLIFLKTLHQNQSNLKVIKLIEDQSTSDLERHGISTIGCYPEPFDPEMLVDSIIQVMNEIKNIQNNSNPREKVILVDQKDNFSEIEIPPFFRDIQLKWYEKIIDWIRNLIF